jgi:hypothetical protein
VRGRERERCEIIVVLFQARVISQGEEEDITIMRNVTKHLYGFFFIYFGILSFLHFFLTNNFYMVKFVPHFILTFSL